MKILKLWFIAAALGGAAAFAAPFNGSYTQDFNSMGTSGTAAPTGWAFYSVSGGHDTFAPADSSTPGVAPSAVGGTANATLIAATPGTQRSAQGYNFGLAASPGDRALGSSPSGNAAGLLELSLTNNTGSSISSVDVSYDIRRFSTTTNNNGYNSSPYVGVEENPGYRLFYSLNEGSSWTNVAALNPTLSGPGGIVAPNSVGVTSVASTAISLGSSWGNGTNLLLRWFDDNAQSPSPDQLLGLDNVVVSVPEPMCGFVMGGFGLVVLCGRRFRKE